MKSLRHRPLRDKLMLIIALTTGIGLALNLLMTLATSVRASREAMQSQLVGIAQVVAANSAAPIVFQDPKSAAVTLAAVAARSEVRRAVLRQTDGRVFAVFPPATPVPELESVLERVQVDGAFWDAWMHISVPVRQDGETVGMVALDADLSAMWSQVLEGIAVAAAATALAFAIAYVFAGRLQRLISEPILQLSAVAEAVGADKDYTRRVEVEQRDEIGDLAHALQRDAGRAAGPRPGPDRAPRPLGDGSRPAHRAAASGQGPGRGGQPRQVTLPGQHEPRDPHADERRDRHGRPAAGDLAERPAAALRRHLRVSAESLLHLLNDVLDLSKIEADKVDLESAPYSPQALRRAGGAAVCRPGPRQGHRAGLPAAAAAPTAGRWAMAIASSRS